MRDAYDRIKEGLNEALAFAQGEKTGAILHEIAVPRVNPFIPSEGSPERRRTVEGCATRAGVSTSPDTNGGGSS